MELQPTNALPTLRYAGIGSRRTPPEVLGQMGTIAEWLERTGWHLASGGANGADSAFADAASPDARTIFLPWRGYNGCSGPDTVVPSQGELDAWMACASDHHPAWGRCSPAIRKLHARNAAILLGRDLSSPVSAVIAWTPGGRIEGGTGMGIRIAQSRRIPVLNLGQLSPRSACEWLRDIRRGVTDAPRAASSAPSA